MEQTIEHVGKRMKHELTGLEIKLLSPNGKGWRAQVLKPGVEDYVVNIPSEDLRKRFQDVVDE